MRGKIIAVNSGIVLLVGLVTYVLLASSLSRVLADEAERRREVSRALHGAVAQLELDALRVERWLSGRVGGEAIVRVYSGGTEQARREAATAQANELYRMATAEADFARMAPNLVLFVDGNGVALGRNGTNLMRGERIGDVYPSLREALRTGITRSDLCVHRERQEQWLASYAPVRGHGGEILGAVIVGTPLTDDRLARTSEQTSGHHLFVGVLAPEGLELLASSGRAPPGVTDLVRGPALRAAAASSERGRQGRGGDVVAGGYRLGVSPLVGYGGRGALVVAVPVALVASLAGELWPVFAVTLLGLLLVVISGLLLGQYFQRPITQLEAGLLAVINGQTETRFELEHAELGGLVSRLNSLLDALTGAPEESADLARGPAGEPGGEASVMDEPGRSRDP